MDGGPASFDLFFKHALQTNGGWMYDLSITFQASLTLKYSKKYSKKYSLPRPATPLLPSWWPHTAPGGSLDAVLRRGHLVPCTWAGPPALCKWREHPTSPPSRHTRTACQLPAGTHTQLPHLAAPALQDKETHHRVIVGRDYYEPQGVDPQARLCPLLLLLAAAYRCRRCLPLPPLRVAAAAS